MKGGGRGVRGEKSVMTCVAQFLKAYPEAGEDPEGSYRGKGLMGTVVGTGGTVGEGESR